MDSARTAAFAAALCLLAGPAVSATYKCRGADGQLGYQQSPCPDAADGGELTPDITPPSGAAARIAPTTVESQIQSLEAAERQAQKARKATAAARPARAQPSEQDAARCAKQRAEAARWRREVKNGYRDRDEQERESQMLTHHEALIRRYCPPPP